MVCSGDTAHEGDVTPAHAGGCNENITQRRAARACHRVTDTGAGTWQSHATRHRSERFAARAGKPLQRIAHNRDGGRKC